MNLEACHVIWNTYGSWLPGDPRGFRNRGHRIHSSGDYKDPAPINEHAGLLRYADRISTGAVHIPKHLRESISISIREALDRRRTDHFALSVANEHVHLLMQTVLDYEGLKLLIGKVKTISSLSVRSELPGTIWSRGCHIKRTRNEQHFAATRDYITQEQEPGAFVWDFEEGTWWMKRVN